MFKERATNYWAPANSEGLSYTSYTFLPRCGNEVKLASLPLYQFENEIPFSFEQGLGFDSKSKKKTDDSIGLARTYGQNEIKID